MTNSNENIPSEDQRIHSRKLYLKSVTIHSGDHTSSGMIHNISMGGVYIEANASFTAGQEITISYLGSNNVDKIEIQGEVVWANQTGFAVKYL